MKLKIISDIHCDINNAQKTDLKFSDEDFVICCGDTSGDRFLTEQWINQHIKKGIFVGGNHLGYNNVTYDKYDSLNLSLEYLQEKFNNSVYFLENKSITIDNLCFIGCILFTDFELFGQKTICQYSAARYMNDFRYVKFYKNKKIMKLTPQMQENMHIKSLKFIKETCKKNPDKKIIIVTHHAPSMQSVQPQYKNDLLSAAFASNLEPLLMQYPNIKLWCYGHIHSSADYKIGNTRIIANPLGYGNENPDFNPNGILVDTDEL